MWKSFCHPVCPNNSVCLQKQSQTAPAVDRDDYVT